MGNRIVGVKENILDAAICEFLNKGYKDASLREIAKAANTSTNSIYVRFGDKAGLFAEIVNPVKVEIEELYNQSLKEFDANHSKDSFDNMYTYTSDKLNKLIDLIYTNYNASKLLICCNDGTDYSNWLDTLANIESEWTAKYINSIGSDAISSGRLTPEILHMLSSAYWAGVFETLHHDMDIANAKDYIFKIKRFFACGWKDIILNKN